MPPAGFKPTVPASERQQTRTLDRASTGISFRKLVRQKPVSHLVSTFGELRHFNLLNYHPTYGFELKNPTTVLTANFQVSGELKISFILT